MSFPCHFHSFAAAPQQLPVHRGFTSSRPPTYLCALPVLRDSSFQASTWRRPFSQGWLWNSEHGETTYVIMKMIYEHIWTWCDLWRCMKIFFDDIFWCDLWRCMKIHGYLILIWYSYHWYQVQQIFCCKPKMQKISEDWCHVPFPSGCQVHADEDVQNTIQSRIEFRSSAGGPAHDDKETNVQYRNLPSMIYNQNIYIYIYIYIWIWFLNILKMFIDSLVFNDLSTHSSYTLKIFMIFDVEYVWMMS